MTEQHKYYTFTEDVKILIQYAQKQAIDHSVVEAANRLNWAIKKGLRDYGIPVTPIKENKDPFKEEKKQYAEDSRTHELQNIRYRRKQIEFVPEYYSGLNWRDAEHLVGKTVECTNHPDSGWFVGLFKLTMAHRSWFNFSVNIAGQTKSYMYIRTCEETFKHPTINIGGVELPKPETVAPPPDTMYWMFGFGAPATAKDGSLYDMGVWPHDVSRWAKAALKNGTIHLTEEKAKAWADWWKKEVLAKIDEIDN